METNNKHTAGEWKVLMGNYTHFATINKDTNTRICAIELGEGYAPIEQAEANAKLIAAAPKLLEALREALDIIDRMDEQYRDATDKHSSYTQGEHKRLTEAIKQATN